MNRAGDNEYDDYKVAILRNPGPVNWSAVADQHDAPPQAPAVSAAAPPPAAADTATQQQQLRPCPGCGNTGWHEHQCPYDPNTSDIPY